MASRAAVAAIHSPSYNEGVDVLTVVKGIVWAAAKAAGFSKAYVAADGKGFTIVGPQARFAEGDAAAAAAMESIWATLPHFDEFRGGHYREDGPGAAGSDLPILGA
jgi:hypothetical protein